MTALRRWIAWLGWELFRHKLSHPIGANESDTFFASLAINHANIYARGPVFVTLRLRILAISGSTLLL
jgi:hypothetical protein